MTTMTHDELIHFLIDTIGSAEELQNALRKAKQHAVAVPAAAVSTPAQPLLPLASTPLPAQHGSMMRDLVAMVAQRCSLPVELDSMKLRAMAGWKGRSLNALGRLVKDGGGQWVSESVRVTVVGYSEAAPDNHRPRIYRFEAA